MQLQPYLRWCTTQDKDALRYRGEWRHHPGTDLLCTSPHVNHCPSPLAPGIYKPDLHMACNPQAVQRVLRNEHHHKHAARLQPAARRAVLPRLGLPDPHLPPALALLLRRGRRPLLHRLLAHRAGTLRLQVFLNLGSHIMLLYVAHLSNLGASAADSSSLCL